MDIEDLDPLCGLVHELDTLPSVNVIEEIDICVSFDLNRLSPVIMEAFDAFDTLLTKSGSFPKLSLVTVNIVWSCRSHAKWKVIQSGVMAEHFPRLVKNDMTQFKFSARTHCRCRGTCGCWHPRHIIW